MGKIYLSKSKIKDGAKCPLMLWNEQNLSRDLKVWDNTTQGTFDAGREVESRARAQFPKAILENSFRNTDKVENTKKLLLKHNTVFEAAFEYKGTIVQFDILDKVEGKDAYNAVEVKSASSFKDDYKNDVIIQYWVATKAGKVIEKYEVWYVNKNAKTKADYFAKEDVTELVKSSEDHFNALLTRAEIITNHKEAPEVKIGAHCDNFKCPWRQTERCRVEKTPDHVLSLPRFTKAWEAFHSGITTVNHKDFTTKYKDYAEKNKIVIESLQKNKLIIDQAGINEGIKDWKYPLNFFDFEALMSALPILKGQRPYQQVAVQFSNHIYDGKNIKMDHASFLHMRKNYSPDKSIIRWMIKTIGSNQGSIVSYNKIYEMTRIKELAALYPEFAAELNGLLGRFVDLMDIVKDNVYHPAFNGSYSLKPVSVALLGEYGSYSDSLIKSGAEIAKYYEEMLLTNDKDRRKLIAKALIKYCTYDTLNLFLLLKFLQDQSVDLKELVEVNLTGAVTAPA